jgi:hypothetical protein
MAAWINAVDGVIVTVAEPVEALGVPRVWDEGVWGNEAPQDRIIVPGVVELQSCFGVLLLAGVAVLMKVYGTDVAVGLAEGQVAEPLNLGPLAVGQDIQAPQVVPVLSNILPRALLTSATGMSCGLT